MAQPNHQIYSAFEGHKKLAQGSLEDVVLKTKRRLKTDATASILIFSDLTGKEMDFDLRGTEKEILQRLQAFIVVDDSAPPKHVGPGRPKLGVVAREVSLLPRHWEWLATQSGGASATLRRLVEGEMKNTSGREQTRAAQDRTYKFMSTLAGNLPRYEEALRALYAKDKKKFREQIADWPSDIKSHSLELSEGAF